MRVTATGVPATMNDRRESELDSDISFTNGRERHFISPGERLLLNQLDGDLPLSARPAAVSDSASLPQSFHVPIQGTSQDPKDPQENDFANPSLSALGRKSSEPILVHSLNAQERDFAEKIRSFARTLPAEFLNLPLRRSVSRDSSSSSSSSSSESSSDSDLSRRSRSKSYRKSRKSSKRKSRKSSKKKSRKSRKHDARSPTRHRTRSPHDSKSGKRSSRAGDPSRVVKGTSPSAGSMVPPLDVQADRAMRTEPFVVHRALLPSGSNRKRVGSPSVVLNTISNTSSAPKRSRDTVACTSGRHVFASGLSLSASFATELPRHGQGSAPPSASSFPLSLSAPASTVVSQSQSTAVRPSAPSPAVNFAAPPPRLPFKPLPSGFLSNTQNVQVCDTFEVDIDGSEAEGPVAAGWYEGLKIAADISRSLIAPQLLGDLPLPKMEFGDQPLSEGAKSSGSGNTQPYLAHLPLQQHILKEVGSSVESLSATRRFLDANSCTSRKFFLPCNVQLPAPEPVAISSLSKQDQNLGKFLSRQEDILDKMNSYVQNLHSLHLALRTLVKDDDQLEEPKLSPELKVLLRTAGFTINPLEALHAGLYANQVLLRRDVALEKSSLPAQVKQEARTQPPFSGKLFPKSLKQLEEDSAPSERMQICQLVNSVKSLHSSQQSRGGPSKRGRGRGQGSHTGQRQGANSGNSRGSASKGTGRSNYRGAKSQRGRGFRKDAPPPSKS